MAEATSTADERPDLSIDPSRATEPAAYAEVATKVANAMLAGTISALEAQRMRRALQDMCVEITHCTLAEAARETLDPIRKFASLMDSSEAELLKTREAIGHIDDVRISEGIKKKWLRLIDQTIELQRECRDDPAKATVYFLPDQEANELLWLQPHHVWFFEIWTDPEHRNSLIQAPPGHGKTTCMRGLIASEIGTDPRIRCLILKSNIKNAKKEVRSLKAAIRSPRWRALYPGIKVLGRDSDTEDECSTERFSVTRANWSSTEPTVEAAGIGTQIEGAGYDRIYADDISGRESRHHDYVRHDRNEQWVGVIEKRIRNPKRARIRMICTPWHEEDVAGKIIEAVRNGAIKHWRIEVDRFAILEDDKGRPIPLWPERYGAEELMEAKMRGGDVYTCTHRLQPKIQSQQIVRRCHYYPSVRTERTTESDLQIMEAIETCEKWLSIDPSGSGNRTSSLQGVVEFRFTPSDYLFVSNVWFHLMSAPAMLEWIIIQLLSASEPYTGLVIEAQGGISGQVDMWRDQLQPAKLAQQGYHKPLLIHSPNTTYGGSQHRGKLLRHREAAPYYNNGIVRFAGQRIPIRGGASGSYLSAVPNSNMARLTRILENFDGTNNADAVDACNQFVVVNRHRIRIPGLKQEPEPQQKVKPVDPMQAAMLRSMKAIEDAVKDKDAHSEESEFFSHMGVA